MENRWRRIFLQSSPTFSSLLISLICLSGCGAPKILKSLETPISVVSIEGHAAKSGEKLTSGDPVMPGETIVTEDDAVVVFRIKGRAALRLKNAGKLVFDEVADTISLNLDYGTLMSTVLRSNKKFILKTPAVTAGVRGTAFYAEARAIDQTYVCLCEGILELATPDTTAIIQAVDRKIHHHPVIISPDPAGALTPASAAMTNHTNADIDALEAVMK